MLTRVSDVQAPITILPPMTQKQERLINAAILLDRDPTGRTKVTFMHSVLAQVSLPRRRVIGDRFERRSGEASMLLSAGELWNGSIFEKQILPYGPMPRLIIATISAFAIRNRTREVPLGNSASGYMDILGYSVGGGKRGTYTAFRKQIRSLAAVKMTLGFGATTFKDNMIEQFDAWITDASGASVWPKRLILSDRFYASLIEHAVPLNNAALHALRGSSLALDIYAWLAHRLHRVRDPRGDEISWTRIKEQFGQEYSETAQGRKDFRKQFESALADVLLLYPKARVQPYFRNGQNAGKKLCPSPPPVAK